MAKTLAHTGPHDDHHHDDHDDHSLKPYWLTLFALFGLTLVTYLVSLVHLGPWADVVAFIIAAIKATLVIWFFMHVRESTSLVKVTAAAGFFCLLLFFAYLAADVLTREGSTVFPGWT